MIKIDIFLQTLEDVKDFVSLAMTKPYDIELISGKYTVNAKSIMGVFSLDLTQPLMVVGNSDTDTEFANQIERYRYVEAKK